MLSPIEFPDANYLGPLESASPEAFKSQDKEEQKVCNFILALALAFNDLKDMLWAWEKLKDYMPDKGEITPAYGQVQGMAGHTLRLIYALILEVAQLIKGSPQVLNHKLFQQALNAASAKNKKRWQSLVDFSKGKTDGNLMGVLIIVRNKMSFHYKDTKFLGQGFHEYFDSEAKERSLIYVSRGRDMRARRFYFADAATQGGFENLVKGRPQKEIPDRLGELTREINMVFFELVESFIKARGFDWR